MRAGFYEYDITPPLGGHMPGQGRRVIAHTVLDRLYAKALVIENNGSVAAVVALDTCDASKELYMPIIERVHKYTGIPSENICVTSVHTHKGAPVRDEGSINCYGDSAYRDVFLRLAADAVIMAYSRLEEVEVSIGVKKVSGLAFCRNYRAADGVLFTHGRGRHAEPLSCPDEDLTVVTIKNSSGPVGAIVNFSCHQDCVGENNGYSGDFSSVISDRLKDEYGREFVSLFVLGACGDVNHVNPDENVPIEKYHYRMMGNVLADAAIELADSSVPVEGSEVGVIRDTVRLPRRSCDAESVREYIRKCIDDESYLRIAGTVNYANTNKDTYTDVYVQSIRIGDLCMHTFPCELYADFGKEVKKKSPYKHNIIIENSNGTCGYIPTPNCLVPESNMYETNLGYGKCHVAEAGDMLVSKALELSERLWKGER